MPTNAGIGYGLALEEYNKAKSNYEKLKALEKVYSEAPKHKSAEKLLSELKQKISKLRLKIEKDKAKKTGGAHSISVKKEGAAQVTIAGLTNSGKSKILKDLTNSKVEIADYEFTTIKPEVATMDYTGIKIQLVEIPALFEGFSQSDKGPSYMGLIRSSNLVVIVLDGTKDCSEQIKLIEKEFEELGVHLRKIKEKTGMNCLFVINKILNPFHAKYKICWVADLKEAIWKNLNLIYAFTKQPGKEKEWPPVAMDKKSTVKDLAEKVHKEFVDKFKYARVWGKSVKHTGTSVGLDHELEEGDVVEFHTK